MECPKCRLENPTDAITCDCGYSFGGSVMISGSGPDTKGKTRSRIKLVVWSIGLIAVVIFGTGAYNYLGITRPINQAIDSDPRNVGVAVWAHYDKFLNADRLVYDLRSVSAKNSMADVFRVILQSAKATKAHRFSRIELSFRGQSKFVLDGAYFQKLGEEYERQNPVYTMRTFTSYLYRPDGSKAYPEWTGGLLGVLQKEIEQFNDFHKVWYLNELSRP